MTAYLEQAFEVNKICNELADENSRFYFMYSGENLAGYLKLNEAPAQTDINDKYSLEIERIYVTRAFQGDGLGRYLMNTAISKAKERRSTYGLVSGRRTKRHFSFTKSMDFMKLSHTHSLWVTMNRQIILWARIYKLVSSL